MKLLIDFGNSSAKWAGYENEKLLPMQRYSYSNHDPKSLVDQVVTKIFDEGTPYSEVAFVSVLGTSFDRQFTALLKEQKKCQVSQFSSTSYQGSIRLAYPDVDCFGADRLAAMIAAEQRYPGNKIIIDWGTAVTVDVVDKNAVHCGGLILPSAGLMTESLSRNTQAIEQGDQAQLSWLANNTSSAVYSGAHYCLQYGLRGIVKRLKNELGPETRIFFTGGGVNEEWVREFASAVFIPDLVLSGLAVWERSQQ